MSTTGDFGTGYASLRYLAELPVSSVKVDRFFTALVPHDLTSTTILRAVKGASVTVGGVTKKTDATGHVSFHVGAHTAKGTHGITLQAKGFAAGHGSYAVK